MGKQLNFDQHVETCKAKALKIDLNNYSFSQKMSRACQKFEARQLSDDERRSILNITFALGNKAFFDKSKACPEIDLSKNYNLRYIQLDYNIVIDKNVENIFARKAA